MIRTEAEYKASLQQLAQHEGRLKQQTQQMKREKLSREEIKRVLDPVRCHYEQTRDEVASYERLKRGEFDELQNFSGVGRLLIALRIAKGISQRELAARTAVSETQVSRDERNEYHGITVDRATRILEALNVQITTEVKSLQGMRCKVGC